MSLRIRESKYGLALVIQTAQTAGNYVLGFRIDPQEKLHEIYKELSSLHTVHSQTPLFGVNYDLKAMVNDCALLFDCEYFPFQQCHSSVSHEIADERGRSIEN